MRRLMYVVISVLVVATVVSTGISVWLFMELQSLKQEQARVREQIHQQYQGRLKKQQQYTEEVIKLFQDQANINEALIAEYKKVKDDMNSLRGYFSDHTLLSPGVEPRLKTTFEADKFSEEAKTLNQSFNYYESIIEEKKEARQEAKERVSNIRRNYPELKVEVEAEAIE